MNVTALQEIMEFTGLPAAEVERRAAGTLERTAALFRAHAGSPESFYAETDAYLYELANYEEDPFRRVLAERIALGARGTALHVLEHGCGIGSFALLLAQLGLHVFACDVNQTSLAFLRFRSERRGLAERVTVEAPTTALSRRDFYHVASSQHVLEHLVDPVATLRQIYGALVRGGLFFGVAPFGLIGPRFPEHREEHGQLRLEDLCEEVGFTVRKLHPFGGVEGFQFTLVHAVKET